MRNNKIGKNCCENCDPKAEKCSDEHIFCEFPVFPLIQIAEAEDGFRCDKKPHRRPLPDENKCEDKDPFDQTYIMSAIL